MFVDVQWESYNLNNLISNYFDDFRSNRVCALPFMIIHPQKIVEKRRNKKKISWWANINFSFISE